MSRTLYSCTMSLDGFMAGPGGDMQWLTAIPRARTRSPTGWSSRSARCWSGGVPMTATTRTAAPTRRARSAARTRGRRSCSPTGRRRSRRATRPTFVTDLETGVAAARAAAGDRYVNILGAEVARGCLEAGLLDEVLVMVVPLLLGDGTRLFDWPGGRASTCRPPGLRGPRRHHLWYDVTR